VKVFLHSSPEGVRKDGDKKAVYGSLGWSWGQRISGTSLGTGKARSTREKCALARISPEEAESHETATRRGKGERKKGDRYKW